MTILFTPTPQDIADDHLVTRVHALDGTGTEPFAPAALAVLGTLSARLLALPAAPPQVTALGFWLRPAALEQLRRRFAAGQAADSVAAPRGVALHLPPANVDTLFVYSWALSLLAGNCNVVRLPSDPGPVARLLLTEIAAALAARGEAERHLFCGYAIDSDLNARLSAAADLRLVWGGNAKVTALGRLPLRPGGVSLDFPDRHSYAAIAGDAYAALDDRARDELARRFANDVFLFGQQACSSPRILYWVGGAEAECREFLERLTMHAPAAPIDAGQAIAKQLLAHELAAQGLIRGVSRLSPALTILWAEPALNLRLHETVGGVLAAVMLADLDALVPLVRRADQTLVHFGFADDILAAFARRAALRGLSRLVPVGQALDFDSQWDGFDLLRSMSRHVIVRNPPPRREP